MTQKPDQSRRAAGGPAGPPAQTRFTPAQKLLYLQAYEKHEGTTESFCRAHGLSSASLCKWRRLFAEGGEAALRPKPNPRNAKRRLHKPYSPEQRREAVEAYLKSGMTQARFCKLWGICTSSLSKWLRRYREEGPKGLETRIPKTRKPHPRSLPKATKKRVQETKRQNPTFGLRKLRDWLFRYHGTKVSTPTIRKTLKEVDLHETPKPKRKRKKSKPVRRFERSKPRELWQSDITSFVMPRHHRRVYLTVFLDDHSRYIVSWHLATHQRQELVVEALMEGIAHYGKPKEVLTDQGRQYFAWRGKSGFQKLLNREGIRHVVSRAHHPQTLGKTERFWRTVGDEFWDRVRPNDLADARERLGHFISHYNFHRPHQGIGGSVPADRFFGAEDAMRRALEGALEDELGQALGEAPRETVYLFGKVGGETVSLHGQGGRLVVETNSGPREIEMSGLGAPGVGNVENEQESGETGSIQDADKNATAGQGAVESSLEGGAGGGPSHGCGALELLAGSPDEAGGSGGAGGEATADMAALTDGISGYGVWSASPAEIAGSDSAVGGREGAEEARPGTRDGGVSDGALAADHEGASGEPGWCSGAEKKESYEAWSEDFLPEEDYLEEG